ncbi:MULTISPECIES: hypothetical protein [unclassified Nocardiopsis]|uniref:hypothetical protein n=1 Tax=Nocardiopsis TaxID=2013 RepID=UPI00387B39A8
MHPSIKYLLAASGAAVAAGAVTAAVLLPLGAAPAPLNGALTGSAAATEDWGECAASRVEDITREEALAYLEIEGYAPAQGPLDGFEFGYLPEYVTGEPFDAAWDDGVEATGAEMNRTWFTEDGFQAETWSEGSRDDSMLLAEETMSVYVTRSEAFTDLDSYFEVYGSSDRADFLGDGETREFDSGAGVYTGAVAIWIPEPGVAVVVNLSDPDWVGEGEEHFPAGDPEEMLRVLEGITWA